MAPPLPPRRARRAPRDVTPEVLERFIRAGGRLGLAEFLRWDAPTQEAAAVIGDAVEGQRILALALAIVSEGARQALAAPQDGGAGLRRSLVDQALDAAEARLRLVQAGPGPSHGAPAQATRKLRRRKGV